MKKIQHIIIISVAIVFLSACAAKKNVTSPGQTVSTSQSKQDIEKEHLRFVQEVYDNRLYQKNIVADLSFNAQTDSKNITVPGSLHMRKDEVIRLQLFVPLIGAEIGRLEFTPDYVLVLDRMHKEYVKADYSELSFLKENGLTFYSLQALFWNQLLVPGKQQVTDADLKDFQVSEASSQGMNTLSLDSKKMHYEWLVNASKALIEQAQVDYQSDAHGKSTLVWSYSTFKALGSKQFPLKHQFTMSTQATSKPHKAVITLQLDQPTTNADWEKETSISSKYKKVVTDDILDKLLSM